LKEFQEKGAIGEQLYEIIGNHGKIKQKLDKRQTITYHLRRPSERKRLINLLETEPKTKGEIPQEISKTNIFYVLNRYE
jgi:hypothetical protein